MHTSSTSADANCIVYAPYVYTAKAFNKYASLQDAWTPLKVTGAIAVINLAGDYWLIIQKGLGVVGAGITCPVAQYFGAIVFVIYLHRMGKQEKGIPLSWQVILYLLLQNNLYLWPDTCQVSFMSLQLCANTACRVLFSLSIDMCAETELHYLLQQSQNHKKVIMPFQCARSPFEFEFQFQP